MDRDAVARWMDAYRDARVTNDPDRVAALFAAHAGVIAVTFDADGRCRTYREWYAQRELR